MIIGTNLSTINYNNTIQQKSSVSFNAAKIPNTPNDTVEVQSNKKGFSTIAKVGIGLGVIGAIALGIGLLVKGKPSEAKEVINNATLKQDLQHKFSKIFRKDFSETEIDALIENYKQIFTIDNVDDFAKKMFEQIKCDSGHENKNIELVIRKCEPGMARQGGFSPHKGKLILDIECENNIISDSHKEFIFEALVHEFQHVRQYAMAYNADCERLVKALTKDRDPNEVIAYFEDALRRHPNEVSRFGGEQVVKEVIQGLRTKNPEFINLYCVTPKEEKLEIIQNIKKTFGRLQQYDKNSENYKMGIRYLENFEHYIQPTQETMEKYKQQVIEKEAFDVQYIASEILNLIRL